MNAGPSPESMDSRSSEYPAPVAPAAGKRGGASRWLRRAAAAGLVLLALWGASRLDPGAAKRDEEARLARDESRRREEAVRAAAPELGRPDGGVRRLSFSDLAFEVPAERRREAAKTGYAPFAPDEVRALDGKRVRIEGFMLPTRLAEDGRAKECFIMVNQQTCCYGQTPRFCDYIVADTGAHEPVAAIQDRPLVFEGRLRVADVFANGAWTQLYTMELERMGR